METNETKIVSLPKKKFLLDLKNRTGKGSRLSSVFFGVIWICFGAEFRLQFKSKWRSTQLSSKTAFSLFGPSCYWGIEFAPKRRGSQRPPIGKTPREGLEAEAAACLLLAFLGLNYHSHQLGRRGGGGPKAESPGYPRQRPPVEPLPSLPLPPQSPSFACPKHRT